jgi:hypothetical protein
MPKSKKPAPSVSSRNAYGCSLAGIRTGNPPRHNSPDGHVQGPTHTSRHPKLVDAKGRPIHPELREAPRHTTTSPYAPKARA